MESRVFIKSANQLISRIKDAALLAVVGNVDSSETNDIQRQIHTAFQGLQNPTLPSASKLIEVATEHGYEVDVRVLHRVAEAERCWSN